jgi:predicted ATPase
VAAAKVQALPRRGGVNMAEERPDVFIIGGANGAGKTTAALLLLPKYLQTFEFVNADEIARGLNPAQTGNSRHDGRTRYD